MSLRLRFIAVETSPLISSTYPLPFARVYCISPAKGALWLPDILTEILLLALRPGQIPMLRNVEINLVVVVGLLQAVAQVVIVVELYEHTFAVIKFLQMGYCIVFVSQLRKLFDR